MKDPTTETLRENNRKSIRLTLARIVNDIYLEIFRSYIC